MGEEQAFNRPPCVDPESRLSFRIGVALEKISLKVEM